MIYIFVGVEEKVSERNHKGVHKKTGHVDNLPKHEHINVRVLSCVNNIQRKKQNLGLCYYESDHYYEFNCGRAPD